MSRLRKTVVPFVWQPLTVAFTQGTAASVNLSAFVTNPYRYSITYAVAGSLPSGVTLSGGVVSYNGTGPGATAVVQFTANSGQYQATTDPVSVKIKETTVISTKPTWRVNTPATMGSFVRSVGGSFDLSLYSFDAEADPIRYYRSGAAGDTAPSSVLVNETTGIVTIPTGVTVGNYGVGVVLSDGQNFSDPRTFSLSIATTPPVWASNTPSSLGTFQQANGGSYTQLSSFASDPDGDTLTYTRAGTAQDTAPSSVTVNLTTGVVTIPTNLPAASYTLVVRVSDGQGGAADRAFTFASQAAASVEGRIMHTRFSGGISLVETVSYGSGGEIRLNGTDSVTGDSFSVTDPQIWGGYNTSRSSSANIQVLSNGAASLAVARQTHIIGFEDNVAFTNPVTGVNGTQRALKIYRTDGYDGVDQDSFQLYPNTALPQGMFYVRGTVKFNTNFFTNYGLWGVTLAEAKTSSEQRTILSLANYNSAGWMVMLRAENTTGTTVFWSLSSTPGVPFLVNNCLTYEYAARHSQGSDGWAWAAINGSSTFGGTLFQRSGANLPAGDTGKINRLFPFLYYNGFNNGTGANNPQWFLSAEVWDRWPTDANNLASDHPNWI